VSAGHLGERIRTSRRLEFDARHYLRALYQGQPEGTLIAVGTLTRPHFCYSVDDALHWVIGARDVYARITLLGGRPARRGAAADSVALPGVWAEVDVNGGPRAAGGVVTDGAPSVEAALELCHAVLQPTLVVRSGYGVHAYWLFEHPWDIRDAEQRDQAGRLVEGWQRRLRAEAQALGIAGLDATHDLARVLRPAGTYNGKGAEPIPVVLMDDGGPRYTREQVDAEALAPVVPIVEPEREPGVRRKPDELVARYPVLARLARREGKPPGDGSESAWDFALACEARRRVKPPIGRAEAIDLVAHGRGYSGKGARGDYLERTVDKAFDEAKPPDAPPAGADPAGVITAGWKITVDPVVEGWAQGVGLEAAIYLRRKSGEVLHFARLGDLFYAARQVAQVSLELAGHPIPDLSKPTAVRIAQAIVELCAVRSDRGERERDEVESWLGYFTAGLGTIVEGDLLGEGEPRWRVLVAQADYRPDPSVHGIAPSSAGVRDLDGRLWIPAGAFMRHVRQVERATIDWPTLLARLDDLGWERLRVDVHEPGAPPSKEGARHIRRTFYGEAQT
jgi:hypothetical protein